MPRPHSYAWSDWGHKFPGGRIKQPQGLLPEFYPTGNVDSDGKVHAVSGPRKGEKVRAAAMRVRARISAEMHETDVGELLIVSDRDVERVRQDDLSYAAEFMPEEVDQ